MDRAGLAVAVALASVAAPRAVAASPPLTVQVGVATGEQWAERSGWLRDDNFGELRFGFGLGRFVALDVGFTQDLDRLETSFGLGARVRPWAGSCWSARWSPYVRAEASVVGASHLGSNYDLLAGAGHWGGFSARAPWLHWFAELDVVTRIGEYTAVSVHATAGLAVATDAFWR